MMAMFILGGKEEQRLEALFQAIEPLKQHPKMVFLCPEQYTVEMERLVINGLKLSGLLNIEVLSFKRLLHNIERKTLGASKVLIDDTGKTMLLRKALESCSDQLTLFKGMVNQGGFLRECAETIGYFKQQRISPEALLTKGQDLTLSALLRVKLQEFGAVFKAYEDHIQGAYYDQEAYADDMVKRLKDSDLFAGMVLCIAGFTSFSKQELSLLTVLCDRSEQVFVELDGFYGEGYQIEGYTLMQKTFGQLSQILANQTVESIILNKTIASEMDYLVHFFDRYPTMPYPQKTQALSLRAALNDEEEVEGVAVDLLRRIRSEGYRYRDFALLMENVAAYGPTVERIFQEYDIPYFLDFKRSALHHPLPCFVLSLLRVVEYGFEMSDVLEHLKTGFYALSPEIIGRFETIATEEGLSGNDYLFLGTDDLLVLEPVAVTWDKALFGLVAFVKSFDDPALLAEDRVSALLKYFEDCRVPDQLAERISWLKQNGETRLAYEEAQIYNAVLTVLEQQKTLLCGLLLDGKAFFDMLKVGLSKLELASIPTMRDYVTIGNLERTRVNEVQHLYILGANEGVLPPVMKASNLFLDTEREVLRAGGLELEGLETELDEQAAYNLLKALTTPSRGLTVSFTFSDQEGTARRKSMIVERMSELFKDLEIKRFAPERINQDLKLKLKPAIRQGICAMRGRAEQQALTDQDFAFMRFTAGVKGFETLTAYQRSVLTGKAQVNSVGKAVAEKLYPQPMTTSPTRLEKYVRCPFQHFAQYGLSPKLVRENGLEQLEVGNYHHQILDRFSKHLIDSGQTWRSINAADIWEWIQTEEASFLTSKLKRLAKKKKAVAHALARLNRVGTRALITAKKQFDLGRFTQFASELSISRQESRQGIPPIILTLEDGKKVYLEGKIDRVDLSDVDGTYYTRVVDYKTGQKSFDLNDIYSGTALQLTLYMGALVSASEQTFGKTLHPAGIYYSRIDDPLVVIDSGDSVTPSDMDNRLFEALKLSGISLDEVAVLEAMDETLLENGYSDFLPISLAKQSTSEALQFSKASQVVSREDFDTILETCRKKAVEISEAIYSGDIEALPLQEKQQLSCDFCAYIALCGYDARDPHTKVKKISRQDKEQILERMRQEV